MQYRCNRSQRQVAATNHLAWPREFLCTEIFDRILSSPQFAKSNQLEFVNLCLVARQIISQNVPCRHEATCLQVFSDLWSLFFILHSLPPPSSFLFFFCSCPNFLDELAETLAMQANRMCNTIADRPESFRRHALGAWTTAWRVCHRISKWEHLLTVYLWCLRSFSFVLFLIARWYTLFIPPSTPPPPQKKNRKNERKRNSHKDLFSLSPGYCNCYAKFRGVSEVCYGQCESGEYVRTGSVRSCRRSSWIILWKPYW